MNEEAKKLLEQITKKELSSLPPSDIEFLKARRSYLTKSELEYFKPVIEPKTKTK